MAQLGFELRSGFFFVSSARLCTAHTGWVGDVWGEEARGGRKDLPGGLWGLWQGLTTRKMQDGTLEMWLERGRYSRGRGPSMSKGMDAGLSWPEKGCRDAGGGRWCLELVYTCGLGSRVPGILGLTPHWLRSKV